MLGAVVTFTSARATTKVRESPSGLTSVGVESSGLVCAQTAGIPFENDGRRPARSDRPDARVTAAARRRSGAMRRTGRDGLCNHNHRLSTAIAAGTGTSASELHGGLGHSSRDSPRIEDWREAARTDRSRGDTRCGHPAWGSFEESREDGARWWDALVALDGEVRCRGSAAERRRRCWRRAKAKVGVACQLAGQRPGPLDRPRCEVALGERLDPSSDPAEELPVVSRAGCFAEDLGIALLELADGHALKGGDLLGNGVGVDHACSPALGPFRSGRPARGTLSLDPAESASPSTADSCDCSSESARRATALAIPWAMIAASSLRRWRADMAAMRDVLGRAGPLRACMGMSFRPRCQRAGGIPPHLQEGRSRRSQTTQAPVKHVPDEAQASPVDCAEAQPMAIFMRQPPGALVLRSGARTYVKRRKDTLATASQR